MFEIDTGNARHAAPWSQTPRNKSEWAAGNGRIDWSRDAVAAERFHRQFIGRIWSEVDTPEDLDSLMAAESICVDALWLAFPEYAERIDAAEKEVRSMLGASQSAQAVPSPAAPDIPSAQSGKDGKDEKDDFFF